MSPEFEPLLRGEHGDPFRLLGPHEENGKLVVRAFRPGAAKVEVLRGDSRPALARTLDSRGLFEATLAPGTAPYRLRVTYPKAVVEIEDPYSFPPLLSDFDLHLMAEGKDYQEHHKMGAHVRTVQGSNGVHFGVWAPNARRVSVVGDFNLWDGRVHPMRNHPSGIWEIFIPGLGEGQVYKYEILSTTGEILLKSDPYGFAAEVRPKSGSLVYDIHRYEWQDGDWQSARRERNRLDAPISVYEMHVGSWRRNLTYRDLADQLIPYVVEMGFTHIELMPLMEFPFDGSWGYQTIGYFAATSRFGTPGDLMYFIDRCHQSNLGVILDWTPGHFPKDGHGLGRFDGTHLYEHADPRQGEHPDWGTYVFNYGRNEVQNFLVSNALFWLSEYHLDGLRVDAVASMLRLDYSKSPGDWIPNQYGGPENLEAVAFLKHLNIVAHGQHPGCLIIAEESTAWPAVTRPTYVGGLGFDLKWSLGWMHDTLDFMALDAIHRKYHHNKITFSMMYAFSENFMLPLSHDEVVHLKGSLIHKMSGDDWRKFASLRLTYAYMYAHPGKKLLFMGSELAQRDEWKYDWELQWDMLQHDSHRGVQQLLKDLNRVYRATPALHEVDFEWNGFQWLDCNDADHSTLSFLRRSKKGEEVLVVCNFTPVVRHDFLVGVSGPGVFEEILNTDSGKYWGGNVGNLGAVEAQPVSHFGWPYSLRLTLPPLAVIYFKAKARAADAGTPTRRTGRREL